MTRIAMLGVALVGLVAFPAEAQSPKKPDISKDLIGTWEGPYQSEMVPPGSLKLVIARNPNREWQVTLEIFADQPPAAGEVRNFKVEGDTVSWAQTVSEMDCLSTLTLVAGLLRGGAECWQNGAVAVTASFLLEKKKG